MSLCHVHLLRARASSLPLPSPPLAPSHSYWARACRASTCTHAGRGTGDRGAEVRAPRRSGAPHLLVGEAIGVSEELLRGEPILGHVAGAAADQVVRHAAGRHGDPT